MIQGKGGIRFLLSDSWQTQERKVRGGALLLKNNVRKEGGESDNPRQAGPPYCQPEKGDQKKEKEAYLRSAARGTIAAAKKIGEGGRKKTVSPRSQGLVLVKGPG